MGTTYSNCQVRHGSQDAVADALKPLLKEPAYVSPSVNGWVGVYSEGGITDPEELAKQLSASLSCGVFSWNVYDSDVFFYTLYESGAVRDEFNSAPDYFEGQRAEGDENQDEKIDPAQVQGKPDVLLPLCVPDTTLAMIQTVLHPSTTSEAKKKSIRFSPTSADLYLFAEEQAAALAVLLGMNEELAHASYSEVEEGELGKPPKEEFRLVGNENLSQGYKNAKLWHSFRLEDLKSVVAAGADVNARDNQGVPLLVRIARYCLSEQIQYLISKGADVNAAALADFPDHALYVQVGAALENGLTPLMVASGASIEHPTLQLDAVQVLLRAGADVNARSESGRTALSEALAMTDWQNHRYKISRRAPEDVLRKLAGWSAEIVEMLRAAGATE